MTVHQRRVSNDPIKMRNSPTNPFRPGTPTEDSMISVNTPA